MFVQRNDILCPARGGTNFRVRDRVTPVSHASTAMTMATEQANVSWCVSTIKMLGIRLDVLPLVVYSYLQCRSISWKTIYSRGMSHGARTHRSPGS